jgi:organic hydroperoxide reductase OsmC/OhrA
MSTLDVRRTPSLIAERQAPLRSRYATHPDDAISTKWAKTSSATVGVDDPFHVDVEFGREHRLSLRLGVDDKVGGLGDLPNPGDLLCAALAACEDGTIRMLANLLKCAARSTCAAPLRLTRARGPAFKRSSQ